MTNRTILLAEPSKSVGEVLIHALRANFKVSAVERNDELIQALSRWKHDGLVLNLGLLGPTPTQFIERLRQAGDQRPLVCLSHQTDPMLASSCYDAGADGFFQMPFRTVQELPALLRRLFSVRGAVVPTRVAGVRLPPVSFSLAGAEVGPACSIRFPNGKQCELRPKEMGLLYAIHQARGRLLERTFLIQEVWQSGHALGSKTVDSHLVRLRNLFRENQCDLYAIMRSSPKVGWYITG